MSMRKFGAPASSHIRLITAEDVDVLNTASAELSKTEHDFDDEDDKKNKK